MQASQRRNVFDRMIDGMLRLLEDFLPGYVIILSLILIGGVFTLAQYTVDNPGTGLLAMIGFVLTFAALICLPVVAVMDRLATASIEKGEVWARWRYTEEDQRRIARARLAPKDPMFTVGGWIPGLMAACLVLIFFGVWDLFLPGLLLITGTLLIVGLVSLPLYRRHRRYRALYGAGLREAQVGPAGLKVDGEYLAVTKHSMLLHEVIFRPSTPAVITFTSFYYRYDNRRTYRTGHKQILHLPVPAGCEEEAAALVRRFQDLLSSK